MKAASNPSQAKILRTMADIGYGLVVEMAISNISFALNLLGMFFFKSIARHTVNMALVPRSAS